MRGCREAGLLNTLNMLTSDSILQGNSWRNEFIDVFVDGDDELFQQSVKRLLSEGKKNRNLQRWNFCGLSASADQIIKL